MTRLKEWGVNYRSNLQEKAAFKNVPFVGSIRNEGLEKMLRAVDFSRFGLHLDWEIPNGAPGAALYGGDTPCGLAEIPTEDFSAGDLQRFTIHGRVIDFAKRNNMGFALVAKEMGFSDDTVIKGPTRIYNLSRYIPYLKAVGSPDGAAAIESYSAGIDHSLGIPLDQVMSTRGLKMLEPTMRAIKEWPSYESTTIGELTLKTNASAVMEGLVQ